MSRESLQKMRAKAPLVTAAVALTLVFVLTAARAGSTFAGDSTGDTGRTDAIARMTSPLSAARTLDLTAVLKLHNRDGLEQLIRDQHDPVSPNYRRWLTPAEFTQRFGPTQAESDRVAGWLAAKGFIIDSSSPSTRLIRFHAPVAIAAAAFDIKFAASSGERLYANLKDPHLPSDIAPLVDSIGGLDNLEAKIIHARLVRPGPDVDVSLLSNAFGPLDIYSFYDELPLLDAAPAPIDGRDTDCVAVTGDSDFDHASTDAFNTQFGLPAFNYSVEPGTNFQTVYADSTAPGITDELEALIDVDYVHALAPGADIVNYVGNDSHGRLGFLDAARDAINQDRCGTISISYGICGVSNAFFKEIDSRFAQAAVQGQSIFVAAGDYGAASYALDATAQPPTCVPGNKRGVEGLESSPHVTSVGGTMFSPNYDDSGNDIGSVPESVWNDAYGAGGGGKSNIFAKPKYQKGLTPKDAARDVPDISFGAGLVSPGFYIVSLSGSLGCTECVVGGTSVGAPSWAGISMLIQQELATRPGLINPELYRLAPSGTAAGLRDVTTGNNSYNGINGYSAVPGYDQASGWGTPDITDFVEAFVSH